MYRKQSAVLIIGILFIFVMIKGDIDKHNEEQNKQEYVEVKESEEQTDFIEGTVELPGESKKDYEAEQFSLFFEDDKLEKLFLEKGRLEYLQYSLYAYLYDCGLGDTEKVTVLKDYEEMGNRVIFVVELQQTKKYINGTYFCVEDVFKFEDVESIPGRTTSFQEENEEE